VTTTNLQRSVEIQRTSLHNLLVDPAQRIAAEIATVWDNAAAINNTLEVAFPTVPYATYLYVLDTNGIQRSHNASRHGMLPEDLGRDRSARPYLQPYPSKDGMSLSESYISLRSKRPSVSAIQPIHRHGQFLGFLGIDVDLRDLPLTRAIYDEPTEWQQLRGDPIIRGQLFQQSRMDSLLDQHIDEILAVLEELMAESGIFHGKIHFASSRATIWHSDDPFRYRLLNYDALIDPDICLAYPHRPYPKEALVGKELLRPILETFKYLRFADATIYLRAGSINIFNGIVGLNFSCDGSHYIPYKQFLAKDSAFWEGIA
jgi:hypothetical protein